MVCWRPDSREVAELQFHSQTLTPQPSAIPLSHAASLSSLTYALNLKICRSRDAKLRFLCFRLFLVVPVPGHIKESTGRSISLCGLDLVLVVLHIKPSAENTPGQTQMSWVRIAQALQSVNVVSNLQKRHVKGECHTAE